MSYKLFIDDLRNPVTDDWIIARTSDEAILVMIERGCPNEISFDHDLGGNDTSMVVVKWLINSDLDHPGILPGWFVFSVHSANPVGAANITGLLNGYLNSLLIKSHSDGI